METGLACARRHGGRALAFIKPWAVSEIIQKMEMAAEAGCRVVACDLESIGLITLRQMGRPAYAKDARELAEIAGAAHRLGLKFVLKGVMSREDALAGLEAGVDGLVVSNHGGRVLDGTPGTAEVLPQIAGAVRGRLALLADGGVRSGVDILKMLALGAEAVFIGRPYAVAAIGGGAAGVDIYTGQYRSQLEQALIMTGCPGVAMAGPHLLDRPTAGDLYAS
jgi:isopentenyl diphosphate isomerase/L-lactate dehydrogenase-like FMN-dependent dehydrogenase